MENLKRRYTLQTLRDFGVGKTTLEEKIIVEIDASAETIDKSKGSPIEIGPIVHKLVGNVIHGIVFGCRKVFDDPDFDMVQKLSTVAVNSQRPLSLGLYLPIWTTWLFSRQKGRLASLKHKNLNEVKNYMSPVKRICVFEHSVITNFNCACPAIQRGQGSGFQSEGSS